MGLDIKICRKNGKFVTSIYRKQKLGGVFTNYESFIPAHQNRGLLHTLLHMSFSMCCDFKTFHFEINHLKTIFIKNNYPPNFIHSFTLHLMYLKEKFLLGYRSWEVLRFKIARSFKNYLVINWRLVISKSFLRHPLESKPFSPSKKSYQRCYFQDLFTGTSVVAAMLSIMARPNTIL